MSTRRMLASMSGDWGRKLSTRIKAPGLIRADLRRLAHELQRDFIRIYAAFHEWRKTPGRVYRIPGRACRLWLPIASGVSVAERRFGVFEPETFAALEEIVRPSDTVIEIGACYGEFTQHLSRLVGPNGHVYSFELFPPYFAIAERNAVLNRLTNVTLRNCAVGRAGAGPVSVDTRSAHPYGSLDQISHLDYSARTPAGRRVAADDLATVPTISLREFLSERALRSALIFMDIEGCELEVLSDVQPLLRESTHRPRIYFELHAAFYGREGMAWLERFFTRNGYEHSRIGNHWWCRPVHDPDGMPIPPFDSYASAAHR